MKLNNKGFAITSVLYGLLILFVILVGSYLTILVAKKNRLDKISEEINEKYGFNKEKEMNNLDIYPEYEADYTGKYFFDVNFDGDTLACSSYITKGTTIKWSFDNGTFIENDCNTAKKNNNISSLILKKIYYNGDETNE